MAFRFENDESFLKGIQRIARERVDRVLKSLSEKPLPGPEAIHQARKDLKSLRALLQLLRGSMDRKIRQQENAVFREIGRSLSSTRDRQVMLQAIEQFRGKKHAAAQASGGREAAMHAIVSEVRGNLQRDTANELSPGTLKQMLRDLRAARRRIGNWLADVKIDPEAEWDLLIERGLRQTYKRGRDLVIDFDAIGLEKVSDETWHDLRKSAKALGFQLRLLRPVWSGPIKALLDEVDRLGERLGDEHDLTVLRAKVVSDPHTISANQGSADDRRAFVAAIDRRKRKIQSAGFKLAARIYVEKPRQFEQRLAHYCKLWHETKPRSKSEYLASRSRPPRIKPGNSQAGQA